MSQTFIERVALDYVGYRNRCGTPILASVLIAQACLESNYGQSELARNANNLAGLKASPPFDGEKYNKASLEEYSGVMKSEVSAFCKFPTIQDCIRYHANFCQNTEFRKRYYASVLNATIAEEQARALAGKYATDSRYGEKLIGIINQYNLKKYDEQSLVTQQAIQQEVPSSAGKESKKMPKILCVAGHGAQPNGGFDPGATGLIAKGENRYMREHLFPSMKKFLPDGHNVEFFDAHDCYAFGDIVGQAKQRGNDTVVCEFHYDAASSSATGGHVIIHKNYQPDSVDKALVQGLQTSVGLSGHQHNGMRGLSGRDDLANVSRTYHNDVNYRLIEVGFGTNANDVHVMMNETDKLAKAMVKALCGNVKQTEVKQEIKAQGDDEDMMLIECEGKGIGLLNGGKLVGIPKVEDVHKLQNLGVKLVKVSRETFDHFENGFK